MTTTRFTAALVLLALGLAMGWDTPKPEPVVSLANHSCGGALEQLGPAGGTLLVPKGVWKCGPMNLTSHTVLYLESGATLKADTGADWPLYGPLSIYGQGHDHPGPRRAPFLGGFGVQNLTIGGENGTIDGSGFHWYAAGGFGKFEKYTRPSLFECVGCTDLDMRAVTFAHSSFWTIHPVLSRRVTARRITVLNPITVPNTDGFDPDSTSDVLLEDSYFHVNDDAIAIKAGWDCAGMRVGVPSNNITIRNLSVWHGGGGISIGSEMSGGVSNVRVDGALLQHGSYGLQVKTGDTRGGFVENITLNNITIVGALKNAIRVDAFYGFANPSCGAPPKRVPPVVRNIAMTNVVTRRSNLSLHLAGLLDAPSTNISLVNVSFDDRTFSDCYGGIQGVAVNVSPRPPAACGLDVQQP